MYLLSIHKLFDHWSNTFCLAMLNPLFDPEAIHLNIYFMFSKSIVHA